MNSGKLTAELLPEGLRLAEAHKIILQVEADLDRIQEKLSR